MFELGEKLPIPLSVAGDRSNTIVQMQAGAIIDGSLVRALNDMVGDEDADPADR